MILLELVLAFVAGAAVVLPVRARRRRRLETPPRWPTPIHEPLSHVTRSPR